MTTRNLAALPLTLLFLLLPASLMASEDEWPAVSEDGLHLVPNSRMAAVYVQPGADLAPYSRVMLAEPQVAFRKNWERDLRSQSASKLSTSSRVNTTKIKENLAQEFKSVFTDKLAGSGYEVVTDSGEDVLLILPAIVNLDITAPETSGSGRTNSYVRSAGEMTLYIELYDSVTGDIIAKAVDRQIDRETNQMYTWANSATNRAAAERILSGWADILITALNDAKTSPSAPMAVEE
jgi:hypothetical protein